MVKKLLIDYREVEEAFLDCLFKEEELKNIKDIPPKGVVIVEGVYDRIKLHSGRLEEKRAIVTEWLEALPHEFRIGWSFLNADNQENGMQWTNSHKYIDQLFCLGMGLGLVRCTMPRKSWRMFRGGMPYYGLTLDNKYL